MSVCAWVALEVEPPSHDLVVTWLFDDDEVGVHGEWDAAPQHDVVALVERADRHATVWSFDEAFVVLALVAPGQLHVEFDTPPGRKLLDESSDVFGDVDSGEIRSFPGADGCVYGGCTTGAAAPHGIGFSVQLWEKDLGHVNDTLYDTAEFFQQAGPIISLTGCAAWVGKTVEVMGRAMETMLGWADDDLIGSRTYSMSAEYLISRLSRVGLSFTDTQKYEGASTSGGANYTMTLQVTRVA